MSINGGHCWKLQEYVAHGSDVKCLALGQNSSQMMVTGGDDMKVNVWSLNKPNCLLSLSGHTSSVEAVRLNHKGVVVGGGSSSGVLKIWDLEASKVTHSFSNHKAAIQSIEFHASGPFVATGSADHHVKLWDLRRKGCINTYKSHTDGITCVRFSPDGRWLASSDKSGTIKLWKLDVGKELCEFKESSSPISSIAFNPKDMILASGSSDGIVKFWDLDKLQAIDMANEESGCVRMVLFHPEGLCLYCLGVKSLSVYRMDPLHCCSTLQTQYSNATDMVVVKDQLIGADFSQNKVSTFVVDITKIPPIGNDSLSPSGTGRHTFKTDGNVVNPAAKPRKAEPKLSEAGDEISSGGVEVKDPEFSKILKQGNQFRPFEVPSGEGYPPGGRNKAADDRFARHDPYAANRDPHPAGHRSESETLQFLSQGHGGVMNIVSSRHRNLRVVKSEWMSNGVRPAMDVAIGQRDQGTIVDLLHVLLGKLSLWNLDLCQSLLPVLAELLRSKYENYMHISLSSLRLIVQTFGSMIKGNIASPPSAQIDLARQDRYYKCLSCYKELMQIRSGLDQLLVSRYNTGRLGQKFQEIHLLISQMK